MKSLILFFLSIFLFASVYGQAERGLEIAKLAKLADAGFESSEVTLIMNLKNANGQTTSRDLFSKTLELTTDGDKSLIVFQTPRDVKGTSMLTFTNKEGPDDQWLFLPSIKRVKRISSSNKSGPFMGSEFAYEDLSSQEIEKYTYLYVGEETMNGDKTYKVERYPIDPKSGYKKQVVWYNADKAYRIEKITFYDRKDALLKSLVYKGYKLYKNKHWRAGEMIMTNHQSKKETQLIFSDYRFKTGLADSDFTQNSLIRAGG